MMRFLLVCCLWITGCASAAVPTAAMTNTDTPALPTLDELWDFADPGASEDKFREALRSAVAADDRDYEAEALTQIARAQGLQRKFVEAHATLDRVVPLLEERAGRVRVRYLLERGRVFNSSVDIVHARPLFLEAWDLARKLNEIRLAVDAAHMVAIVEAGDPAVALKWNLTALDYLESSDDSDAKRWRGPLYNNIGWTYFDDKQYLRALEFFERALHLRDGQGKPRPILIAQWSVARTLRALGRVEEALAMQKRIEQQYRANGLGEDGFVYEELGECYLELGRQGHEEYFAKAYALLSQDRSFAERELARLQRMKHFAGVD